MLEQGNDRRHVAATKMNSDSSRSHLLSTFLLEVYNRSKKTTALGKITLVDLAGSERLKKSEATGEQMKVGLSFGGKNYIIIAEGECGIIELSKL